MILAATDFLEGTVPMISVAMPVYNGARHLAEAIDSILIQTFEDFELIIIDDGSTDVSLHVVREYQKRDSRIRLISRGNKNLVATLNEIVDLARGKWIARMDQDDIALPHRFKRQLEWLEHTGADISGSWVKRFGTSDKRVVRSSQTDEAVKIEMLFCSPFAHPSVMMRTSLIKQLRYDNLWEKAEDYDLWVRAAQAGCKMTNVPEVLLLYRVHKSQISTALALQQQKLTLQIQEKYWKFFLCQNGLLQLVFEDVLKIRALSGSKPNMDGVDAFFSMLLKYGNNESKNVIFGHAARLYIRVATQSPDVFMRWQKVFHGFGWRKNISIEIKLGLLWIFRISPDGYIYMFLRKLYIAIFKP